MRRILRSPRQIPRSHQVSVDSLQADHEQLPRAHFACNTSEGCPLIGQAQGRLKLSSGVFFGRQRFDFCTSISAGGGFDSDEVCERRDLQSMPERSMKFPRATYCRSAAAVLAVATGSVGLSRSAAETFSSRLRSWSALSNRSRFAKSAPSVISESRFMATRTIRLSERDKVWPPRLYEPHNLLFQGTPMP